MTSVLMTMEGRLVFTAEGEWLHDGAPVTHEKIRDYFGRHLIFSNAHKSYVIEADGRCVTVEVEDTPIVVRTLETFAWPWFAKLSDGTKEEFAADTLEVSSAGVFYCRVHNRTAFARILRPAWQALLPCISESKPGSFIFRYADADHGLPKVFGIRSR